MTKRRASTRLAATRKKAKAVAEENEKKEEVSKRERAIRKKAKAVAEQEKPKEEVSIEQAVEEEDQSTKEEEPFPLEELNLDMLSFALEKLRVEESMTLMATSKSMKSFYESKAQFKIPFEIYELKLIGRENGAFSLVQFNGLYFGAKRLKKTDPLRSNLPSLPFRFFVKYLTIEGELTPAGGQSLKERMNLLKINFIEYAHLASQISSQEFDILEKSLEGVTIDKLTFSYVDLTALLHPFVSQRRQLNLFARALLPDHVTAIQNPVLVFGTCHKQSKEEIGDVVEAVIEKWNGMSCELKEWKLRFCERMTTCEALETLLDSRGPIDFNSTAPIPSGRPLYFIRKGARRKPNQYYLLRRDDSLVHLYFDSDKHLTFKVVPLSDGPPALVL